MFNKLFNKLFIYISGCLELSSLYRIEKRPAMKGKPFVCQIVTGNKQLVLATEDEKMFHLLVFFVQAQTKIKDELEGTACSLNFEVHFWWNISLCEFTSCFSNVSVNNSRKSSIEV